MMSESRTKVLVFGLGAIGGFYAFIFGQVDSVEVSVVARSNYESVKQDGLKLKSEIRGDHNVRIDNVYRSPSDAGKKFDYIVCAHKAIDPASAPPLFKDVANENTTFVLIQNGVGNEEPFRKVFPKSSIISCVTWTGATQHSPGVISHGDCEDMQIGLFPNPNVDANVEQSRLKKFAELLEKGGTTFQIEEDIQMKRWEKCTWNAVWNPVSTLTQATSHQWLDSSPEAIATTRQLWTDMITVAQHCGVPLELSLIDELMEKIRGMTPVYSSMYVDSKEGRPLEIEVILGTAVKKAKEFGLDVPVLRTVYALTNAVDQRIRQNMK